MPMRQVCSIRVKARAILALGIAIAVSVSFGTPLRAQSPVFEAGVNAETCFLAYRSASQIARNMRAQNRMFRLRQIMESEPEAPGDEPATADTALVTTLHACERSLATSGSPFADFSFLLWRTRGPDGGWTRSNFQCAATYLAHAEIANRPASATRGELSTLLALSQQAFRARLAEFPLDPPEIVEQAVMREAAAILDRRGLLPDARAQADFDRGRTDCDTRFSTQAPPG
ncbi:hypothetical protein [Aquisalinus flavus]|nr:hypothetical protein [Aquisalinus flavus]MBD0425786.1 hypothetical protein [Aquisalinus flavus]UNE48607.1 hypothetical protein FF099_11395 [Aquisalinus flavus]